VDKTILLDLNKPIALRRQEPTPWDRRRIQHTYIECTFDVDLVELLDRRVELGMLLQSRIVVLVAFPQQP